jgi:hypothetical protein
LQPLGVSARIRKADDHCGRQRRLIIAVPSVLPPMAVVPAPGGRDLIEPVFGSPCEPGQSICQPRGKRTESRSHAQEKYDHDADNRHRLLRPRLQVAQFGG